jgi:medium-chain acyl-[acyl-carrier-protein] hydrolase
VSAVAGSWLVRARPRSRPRLRLFCVPHAGVGPSAYRQWIDSLPADIEVALVHLPGRESRLREAPYTQIEPLVNAAVTALRPYLDIPYAMFGHSMGALVAFELARRFEEDGQGAPRHLFVSGRRAPQMPTRRPPIAHLPDDQFVREIRSRYNGIPDEVLRHPDLLALLLPGLRADLTLVEGYVHRAGSALPCPIVAMGGLADAEATEAELVGWRHQTTAALSVRMFPGGHFYLQTAHEELMRIVTDALMVADGVSGSWS